MQNITTKSINHCGIMQVLATEKREWIVTLSKYAMPSCSSENGFTKSSSKIDGRHHQNRTEKTDKVYFRCRTKETLRLEHRSFSGRFTGKPNQTKQNQRPSTVVFLYESSVAKLLTNPFLLWCKTIFFFPPLNICWTNVSNANVFHILLLLFISQTSHYG